MKLSCHSGECFRLSDMMQEGWFAFRVPAIVALWKIWCVCAFVCLSLLWSQSVFHFLPVWLIIFSIVASLQKKKPLLFISPFLFSPCFFLLSIVGTSWLFFLFFCTVSGTYCSMTFVFPHFFFYVTVSLSSLWYVFRLSFMSFLYLPFFFYYYPCFLLSVNAPYFVILSITS